MNTRDEFLTNNDPILKRELEQTRKKATHDARVNTTTAVEFRQRRVEIEEREPPKLRVIDLLCHNELGTSTYRYKKPTRLNGSDDPSGASSTSRWRTSLNNRQTCRNSSDARTATDGRGRARHATRSVSGSTS